VGEAATPASREPVGLPGDAVVVRFRPTDPEKVLEWARKEFRRTGHYRLSVFADARRGDEDDAAVIQRLLEVSELVGLDASRNPRYYVCATSDLQALNFAFYKDEDDDEPEEHYSVDLGEDPTVEDVVRFLGPFGPPGGLRR
jgi:hypothetical protein